MNPDEPLSPTASTLLAELLAIPFSQSLSFAEQNALSEWFILFGQIISTYNAQAELIENKKTSAAQSGEQKSFQQELLQLKQEVANLANEVAQLRNKLETI